RGSACPARGGGSSAGRGALEQRPPRGAAPRYLRAREHPSRTKGTSLVADRTQRGSRAERRARARHHDANGGSASEARAEVTIPKWLPPLLFVLLTSYLFRTFVFSD